MYVGVYVFVTWTIISGCVLCDFACWLLVIFTVHAHTHTHTHQQTNNYLPTLMKFQGFPSIFEIGELIPTGASKSVVFEKH